MEDSFDSGDSSPSAGLPLRRLETDRHLWAKVAALWHRERTREAFRKSGYAEHEARLRSNEEALRVARSHGWSGTLPQLKRELADLLDPKVVASSRFRKRYWEDVVRKDLLGMLSLPPDRLKESLIAYIHEEVSAFGPFEGNRGLYKLAYLIGFVPTLEHLNRRNAFLHAMSEVGHDPDLCDPDLFRIVFRLLRAYTMAPFESRQGVSMPVAPPPPKDRSKDALPRRRLFARLRRRLRRRRPSYYGYDR